MYHKADLRKQNLQLRESMAIGEYSTKSSLVCDRLTDIVEDVSPSLILSYSPIKNEVDISTVAHLSHEQGIPYAIPLINMNNRHMDFYVTHPARELIHNKFGIKEPAPSNEHIVTDDILKGHNVICLIPALAFDLRGNRIGYGKGFYDTFLHRYPHIVKIGLAFEFQIVYEIAHSTHDIPADIVVTDKRVIRVKG